MADVAGGRESGVTRIFTKLHNLTESGNFYEAHQLYRTIYFRYLNQKKYDELLTVLYSGATLFLRHDQQVGGADLSILYIDVLTKSATPVTNEILDKLPPLLKLMSPNLAERETFINKALKWSIADCSTHKSGHPALHRDFAGIFWEEKNYVLARYHFLHSEDGKSFARMLVEIHCCYGYASEIDLFIAQVVLQYLCLKNRKSAVDAFQSYTSHHPNIIKGPPFILPLLNFLYFLLKVVRGGQLATFTVLLERYEQSIRRDPSYTEYLDKIAQLFFDVPPPPPRRRGILDNLLQSIIMNGNEFDSDEGESDGPSLLFSSPSCSYVPQRAVENEDLD
ncbi:unnamed protein product [Bemisia tabaci]|uniref:Golgi to ER traffic protein 4 n=1 Tax=Bemisia tabaci TaxID=7038 RepID=A0A9P0ACP9_BEMTA|nr:unnamed protein product [Bemisia tabaci]